MFWRFSYSTSQIQTLLEKEDVTLEEIMNEEDVLQECKSTNEKLLEFLTTVENLSKLVDYIVSVPSENLDEKQRFKYSSISCELLTCDINSINDALINKIEIIDRLYSFIDTTETLNPLLASFFAKLIGCLIKRNSEYILNYVEQKENFVHLFVQHINTSAIIDVILRLITAFDNIELRTRVIQWLKKIQIVKHVINLFDSKYCSLYHSNASQLICDIIRISRDQILNSHETLLENKEFVANESNQDSDKNTHEIIENLYSNSLLEEIESLECVEKVMMLILDSKDKVNCSISYGIDIYLAILDKRVSNAEILDSQNFEYDVEKKNIARQKDLANQAICTFGLKSVIKVVHDNLDNLNQILIKNDETVNPQLKNHNGLLGASRLSIVKLISKLISFRDNDFTNKLLNSNTLNIIIESAFFKYKWNNFLHTQLSKIITNLFLADFLESKSASELNSENTAIDVDNPEKPERNFVIKHFLKDCNLIKHLVNAWLSYQLEKKSYQEKNIKSINVGFVGHLSIISNFIDNCCKEGENAETIRICVEKYTDEKIIVQWKELIDTQLADINRINMKDLVKNPFILNNNDSLMELEFTDLIDDEKTNKRFAELQKEMKIDCVEEFSLPEGQILNFSNRYGTSNKANKNSFIMESNDESANIFEQICFHRNNANDQAVEKHSEDVWVTKEIKLSENYSITSNEKKENLDEWINAFDENEPNKTGLGKDKQINFKFEEGFDDKRNFETKKLNSNDKFESSFASSSSTSSSNSTSDEDEQLNEKTQNNSIEGKKSKKSIFNPKQTQSAKEPEKNDENQAWQLPKPEENAAFNAFKFETSSTEVKMDEPGNVKDINLGLTSKNLLIDPWTETNNTGADCVTNSPEALSQNWADFGKF